MTRIPLLIDTDPGVDDAIRAGLETMIDHLTRFATTQRPAGMSSWK